MKKQMNKKEKLQWIRVAVQLIFFIVLPSAFSQAFGGIKSLMASVGKGGVLAWSDLYFWLIVLCAATILIGRVFCGWLCAFGTLGDWIWLFSGWIQKKTGKKLPKIPEKAVVLLQKVKYAVLTAILIMCFLGAGSLVSEYSPWTVFSFLTARNLSAITNVAGVVFFALILVGMAWKERFFCQFLCPMGAVFSLLPKIPLLTLHRGNNCLERCQACRNNCPVTIKLQEEPARDGECIACGRCAAICPKKNIGCIDGK